MSASNYPPGVTGTEAYFDDSDMTKFGIYGPHEPAVPGAKGRDGEWTVEVDQGVLRFESKAEYGFPTEAQAFAFVQGFMVANLGRLNPGQPRERA